MFIGLNLVEEEEASEELHVQSNYNPISEGPIPQNLPPNIHISNNKKNWISSPTARTYSNAHNVSKPYTSN
jgi:hypothetical protein